MNVLKLLASALVVGVSTTIGALAAEVKTLDGFSDFRKPEATTLERPMTMVQDLLTNFPEYEGANGVMTLTSYFEGTELIIDYVEDGIADDSSSAFNRRYVFKPTGKGMYDLVAYGHRQKCARGTLKGKWSGKPCP